MIIGFDGKRAARNRTGLGNYSRWLIENLATFFPENKYLVYCQADSELPAFKRLFINTSIRLRLKMRSTFSPLWRSFGIAEDIAEDQVQLFHGLSHEIPFNLKSGKIKTVLTVHDLIFLRYPHYFKWLDRTIYNFKCRYACRNADHIVAISEQTKRDIIHFYGTKAEKISVIYQSCDDSFKAPVPLKKQQEIREKHALPERYLLSVGTIEERKNLLVLIKALPAIHADYKLVVVGKATPYKALVQKEIERLGLTNRVVFLKDVAFDDLPGIYQMASLFVYASRFEGFGIPLLEALYSGVPAIGATGSCLEEAAGPGSKYISPDDAAQLATYANKILGDEFTANSMREQGLQYARNFSNARLAEQMNNCYKKVLSC